MYTVPCRQRFGGRSRRDKPKRAVAEAFPGRPGGDAGARLGGRAAVTAATAAGCGRTLGWRAVAAAAAAAPGVTGTMQRLGCLSVRSCRANEPQRWQ